MATGDFKRKLTAVFSADVVGYSRLMGMDEAATVKTLEDYKGVMFTLIKQHRGRVVDSPGDNLLAEFGSVVDAVQCAVAVQKELESRNSALPEERRMHFRIGINLGDVIEEKDRLYGDGVNIAGRLEALADAGGICVSKTAFDHIESKLPLGYRFIGEQTVKNIAKPVGAYKVLMETRVIEGEEEAEFQTGRPDKPVAPAPLRPSIAVLPFDNMSNDPEQEYFSDGITEDIITSLSKVSALLVISRNSTFLYKGKHMKIEVVARDLGVSYVLEGSVRRAGGRVRISDQLIDGKTGHHVWADKYDRELEDIFSVQDEVIRKVVSELAVALTSTESDRLPRKHTESFEAYDMYLRAKMEQYVHKKENTLKGIDICQRVIDLDPNFAGGYQLQSFLLSRGIRFGWFPREGLERAHALAQQAKSVDDRFPASYMALASVYLMQGKHDDALAAANRAASLVPGDSDTIVWLGYYLHWVGRGEEAVAAIKKSRELNPKYLSCGYPVYVDFMGQACFTAGLYEDSISNMKTALEAYGPSVQRYPFVIASYSMLGRMEEAKESVRQWLKVDPAVSLSSWNYGRLYKRSQDSERLYEALSKAGLK
jgi:adenylate cyclase